MKLVIDRGELLRGLGHVTSVVEKRTTIPILSNVLLRASERGLQFRATDLEREVLEETPADVSQPGATTVPELISILTERGVHVPGNGQRLIQIALRKAGWVQRKFSAWDKDHRVWAYPGTTREQWTEAVHRRRGYTERDN